MNEFIIVYSAEMLRRLRSRTFWLGLALGVAGVAALMELPAYIQSYTAQAKSIVVAGNAAIVSRAAPLLSHDFTIVGRLSPSQPASAALLKRHGNASAMVVLSRSGGGLRVLVYANDPSAISRSPLRRDLLPLQLELATALSPKRIRGLLTMPVQVRTLSSKFGTAAQADAAKVIAYILLVLLYVLIMVNSQLIMSSVAEEKTSRIAELLLASVNPRFLLAGKIAASASLAIVQMVAWVAVGVLLGAHPAAPAASGFGDEAPPFTLSGISTGDIAGFAVFFVLGYLQIATLFAAVGSLINRTEDLGSVSGPLFLPVIAAFFIALSALAVPESPVVIVTSFIPLIAPFVMFARIVVSSVPFWQIAISFVVNALAIYAIALLGGKLYRVGMLLYGRPPRLAQIWHVLRT